MFLFSASSKLSFVYVHVVRDILHYSVFFPISRARFNCILRCTINAIMMRMMALV